MSDTKKRKNDATEDGAVAKKRKIEVNDADDGDICIIENNDVHHDTPSELKNSTSKKMKSSEDLDCLIVYDDKNSD